MEKYKPIGVKKAYEILRGSQKVLVYYDPDVDGLISGFMIESMLKEIKKPYEIYINENREHGVLLSEEVKLGLRGVTMVVVDALMTRLEVEELVIKYGINVINIDHHHNHESRQIYVESGGVRGVVINNQYTFEPEEERYLSGAGMVYNVMKWLMPRLEERYREDWKALVGISLLSDVRQIENEGARSYLSSLYNLKSEMGDYILRSFEDVWDYGFGERRLDRNFIDYTLSPIINAMFRLNRGYDAIEFIRGNARNLGTLERYRKVQKNIQSTLEEGLELLELSNVIYGEFYDYGYNEEYSKSTFVGLLASKQKNKGKTAIMVMKDNEGKVVRGSVRGVYDRIDYQEICRKYGLECAGHNNAFGFKGKITKEALYGINEELERLEGNARLNKYKGRLKEINNMSFYSMKEGVRDGRYNVYVREQKRVVIRYTGDERSIKKKISKSGKRVEYDIDGVPVVSFDGDIGIERGVIVPIEERGKYIQYYLREW